ncbi:EmrB/QacA subfamily drug resistance transporter [Catenulispora sp. GAS73]|uniref:MFS transporter n=1 Tax=Catenulispora sp. GAS73 TaxID=3156269 RepID=UPI003517C8C7
MSSTPVLRQDRPSFLATPRGKLTLLLLCGAAFLDFVDASIVNVALPAIRKDLHFSASGLPWVPSGYLLTYGGLMLLGGRAADLFGRRRILISGTAVFAVASFAGGVATTGGLLVTARLVQGAGAAMMLPAALSLLTTLFTEGKDRNTALGVWGAVGGLAAAVGVLAGGFLTQGPGWRWVMFVNVPVAALVLFGVYRLIDGEAKRPRISRLDLLGAALVTAGMLLLVYTLVEAPDRGWGSGWTIFGFVSTVVLLAAFVVNEQLVRDPLIPFSIFRVRGLVAANITQMVAIAGMYSMFFFLTLYMQNVLNYSPIRTGLSYVPVTVGVAVGAGITSQLITRIGARPVTVLGTLIAGSGVYLLSRMPVDGSYLTDLLPGLVVMSLGLGTVLVAVTTAANAGVHARQAGLAAALLSASQQIGGAVGIAVLTSIATSHTNDLVKHGHTLAAASTSGFARALLLGSLLLFGAAAIALRISNSHGEHTPAAESETDPTDLPTSAPIAQ